MTGTSDSTHLRLPLTVRVAAFLFLFLGVAFGASVPFVLAHLDRYGELAAGVSCADLIIQPL